MAVFLPTNHRSSSTPEFNNSKHTCNYIYGDFKLDDIPIATAPRFTGFQGRYDGISKAISKEHLTKKDSQHQLASILLQSRRIDYYACEQLNDLRLVRLD